MTGDTVRGYRPWLDGVRAVAVGLVVLQHVHPWTRIAPGGVGVGIFFALSGYLITGLLLDNPNDLRVFYLRRAARLLPALILMVAVVSFALALDHDTAPIHGAGPALLYYANYATVAHGSTLPVFGATWSLAIEEHFYLVWPLAILAMQRRGWTPHRMLCATLVACLAALVWRAVLVAVSAPERLPYVGSLERADAILYGCAAAIAVRMGWRVSGVAAVMAVVALVGVVAAPMLWGAVVGQAVMGVAAAVVIVALDTGRSKAARRLMSMRPLVLCGILSYGIYLWHVPALWFFPVTVAIPVSVAAAWVSHRFVESPVREAVKRVTASGSPPRSSSANQRTRGQFASGTLPLP